MTRKYISTIRKPPAPDYHLHYRRRLTFLRVEAGLCALCSRVNLRGQQYCVDCAAENVRRSAKRSPEALRRAEARRTAHRKSAKGREWSLQDVRGRRKNDPIFRLRQNLRTRLKTAMHKGCKTGSAVSDLGCSIPEFKRYLKSKFQPGMTWDDRKVWHIDHIVPLASVDLTDREQLLKVCHYTNLQPLWAADNMSKGAKVAA